MDRHRILHFAPSMLGQAVTASPAKVEIILRQGQFQRADLRTATEEACLAAKESNVDIFLKHTKLDIETDHRDRQTALAVACARDDLDLLDRVLEAAADQERKDLVNFHMGNTSSCLLLAIAKFSNRVVERLLRETDIDLRIGGVEQLLTKAAKIRNLEAVRMLTNHHGLPPVKEADTKFILHRLCPDPRTVHIPEADLKIVRCVLSRSEVRMEDLPYVINWFLGNLRPRVLRLLAHATGWRNFDKEIKYNFSLRMCLLNKNL